MGSGSPNAGIQSQFVAAFYQNGFAYLVSTPPLADVKKFGPNGLLQEFQDAKKTTGVKLALIMPDINSPTVVYQVLGDIYPYYSSLGEATAGFPAGSEMHCPVINAIQCTYQNFSMSTTLFAFQTPNSNGQNVSVDGAFYTKWMALGGVGGVLGIPLGDDAAVTSSFKTTANVQTFTGGAIYSITSGALNGQTFAVIEPSYDVYQSYSGPTGILGFPTSDNILSTGGPTMGLNHQSFEGGTLQFMTGSTPVLVAPVTEVQLSPPGPLRLNLGDTVPVSANTFTGAGNPVSGRAVSFTTSNGRVVSIQMTGGAPTGTVTLKAVGAGTATIQATSEGQVSSPLLVTVASQCCAVGDGAPSAQVQQAFQDLVTRDRLSVVLPSASPVQRAGSGYVQELISSQPPGARYYVTKSDRSGLAYLVTGNLLTAYLAAGGPAGSLGYPSSDASPGGTQLFENGAALSSNASTGSNAIRMVSGVVLAKWAALGYETGAAGPPTGDASAFTSVSAYTGISQAFAKGAIFGITSGNRAGQAYLVSGLILARYQALGGPAGDFGVPLSDEFAVPGMRRQNFENGYIDYTPGDSAAQEHAAPRQPAIVANPGAVVAGSRLRLSVSGFDNGSTVRVSVTGQPDFLVTTPNGSYDWDVYVPASARGGVITIHAADVNGPATADGSYNITTLADIRPQLKKVQGDGQSGAPGALLPRPLVVMLADGSGNPIAGMAVKFQASGGAQISPVSAATDANGQASALYRLPLSAGISAATAEAAGQIATFNFQSAGSLLLNFPQFTQLQNGGSPSLLAAAAGIVRFDQNSGALPSPHGPADPAALTQFLTTLPDGFVSNPDSGARVVNLWRVAGFVGGGLDVSVESPDLPRVRDLVAAGSPVLLTLALSANGNAAGGAAVVATGIGADGSIRIQDPNPTFARANLNDYLTGFASGGQTWTATVLSSARLVPRVPASTGFLVTAISQTADAVKALDISSVAGPCGRAFDVEDAVNTVSRFLYCDGSQAAYQVTAQVTAGSTRASITDLSTGGQAQPIAGSASGVYKVSRTGGVLVLGSQSVSFDASAVVNAATFVDGLAPGGLFSLFGTGLSAATVAFGGEPATVISSSAFQINAQVPPDLAPGTYFLQVQSGLGTSQQQVPVVAIAPGIFTLGKSDSGQAIGAVVNPDGTVNGPSSAVRRGGVLTIYGTGLGAVQVQGGFSVTAAQVTGVLNGSELPSSFAGLAPGFIGLYQVNFPVPVAIPPGVGQSFNLREQNVDSNTVYIAIQ
ncbi:MAG: Ig-like domain-containing protein [Bryobacteraceae bacterium]